MSNFKKMGDRKLYDYCRQAGTNAHKYKRMLCAAIPEVFKRGLHRKYGFGSIHEFGAKVGGLSQNSVNEAIRVSEKLKDKPKLKELIKDIGLSKLARVANIATKETDEKWAKDVIQLSKAALETKIQELKILKANMKKGTIWDDVFKTLLKGKLPKKQRARGLRIQAKKICEIPGCYKPATEIHHKNPWAITKKHKNLISICKSHHELEHQTDNPVDIKFRSYKMQPS